MIDATSPQATHDAIAVGLMCKPPRPGLTKTRLATRVGAVLAAELSECFLRDVARLIASLEVSDRVQGFGLYTPADAAAEIRALLPASFRLAPQQGADFCVVVHRAIAGLLEQHPAGAILINADSPTLPTAILAEAVRALRPPGERVVIGPARDGGYYLIGLKTAYWALFRDMPWSTPEVCRITIDRARAISLPVVQLPVWYDVDDASSLADLFDELGGAQPGFIGLQHRNSSDQGAKAYPPAPAPATRALLQSRPMIGLRPNEMFEMEGD
ncbi:TIGR04282 family arsenosugar biosynthesis glycosyltransferase [Methylocystis sp. FS]|uniref:TIGR04282 family arsenosugar biosynthesis glycosyltransferase n=1 Tax=Methylocystis silviterrae TaxID=2743612 RepID=UPI00158331FC|nr:TIGR04282 family arsenosugar biosynthesis glycosyltransferase [Methylocystis silviterrae]NUJ81353.1 TIGR04282 family arsenosugar biosynthesis glycosyltransferase [Methylocystis silviterrae]